MDEQSRNAKLSNDKLEAEIANLAVEKTRLQREAEKLAAETARLNSEDLKLKAEATRLRNEGDKFTAEKARLDREREKLEAEKIKLGIETENLKKWLHLEWARVGAGLAAFVTALAAIGGLYLSNKTLTLNQRAQTVQQQNVMLADLTKQLASDNPKERISAAARLGNLLGVERPSTLAAPSARRWPSPPQSASNSDSGISEQVALHLLVWALVLEEEPLVRSAMVASVQRSELDINDTLTDAIKVSAGEITPLFDHIPNIEDILKDGSTIGAEDFAKWERLTQRQRSMVTLAMLRFERQPKDGATTGIDLAGLPLSGYSFVGSSLDLRNANFVGAGLKHADFFGVDLTAADFSEAELTAVNFIGANLEDANLNGVMILLGSNGQLPRANFEGANITRTRFDQSCLAGADFRRASALLASQLQNASIGGALFSPQQDGLLRSADIPRHNSFCREE
jgi:hypothetical protein